MELTSEEGRVLGCLVEKQLTTPQQYPLTENALIAACNQTTNRDPVVTYDVSSVRIAVRSLREKGLLRTVHRTGERSDKHQHVLESALGLSPAQVSLLAVLLLRGPQTPAELRARSERMHPFDTPVQVQEELDALSARNDPTVTRLALQPGRKETRYAQLLVDVNEPRGREPLGREPISHEPISHEPVSHEPISHEPISREPVSAGGSRGATGDSMTLVGLARQVALLRNEVTDLRRQVDDLRRRDR